MSTAGPSKGQGPKASSTPPLQSKPDKASPSMRKRPKDNTSAPSSPTKEGGKIEMEITLATILKEIQKVQLITLATEGKVEVIQEELADFMKELSAVAGRTSILEKKVESLESLRSRMAPVIPEITKMSSAMEDLENRNRRNNLRILGVPEGAEDQADSMEDFLEDLIPKLLKIEFHRPFEVDRAHRTPSRQKQNATKPRQIIFRVLRFQHLVHIRRAVKLLQNISWKGHTLIILQDFAKATVDRRRRFLALRPRLKDAGMRYGMFEPCRMLVTADGKSKSYYNPEDLEGFLNEHFAQPMESSAVDPP